MWAKFNEVNYHVFDMNDPLCLVQTKIELYKPFHNFQKTHNPCYALFVYNFNIIFI